jgi:hypothetical protein
MGAGVTVKGRINSAVGVIGTEVLGRGVAVNDGVIIAFVSIGGIVSVSTLTRHALKRMPVQKRLINQHDI